MIRLEPIRAASDRTLSRWLGEARRGLAAHVPDADPGALAEARAWCGGLAAAIRAEQARRATGLPARELFSENRTA